MAEIKSTLDLIMERTKNLTMTEEEKKAIRTKEVKSRVRGWFQRYIDGSLILEDLKEKMEQERITFPAASSFLREDCLAHLEPEADNKKTLRLMKEILEIDPAPFLRLVDDYHAELRQHHAAATRDIMDILHSQGISGTAVIPNLNLSQAWKACLDNTKGQFRSKLYLVNP